MTLRVRETLREPGLSSQGVASQKAYPNQREPVVTSLRCSFCYRTQSRLLNGFVCVDFDLEILRPVSWMYSCLSVPSTEVLEKPRYDLNVFPLNLYLRFFFVLFFYKAFLETG